MKPRPYRSDVRDSAAAETRAKILAAARDVLADAKQTKLSMETVANRAGVTRLTVYNQFETKQGLLDAAFDDIAEEGGLFELHDIMAGKDPHAALLRVVEIFCRFWGNYGIAMLKLALAASDPDVASNLQERKERRRKLLDTLLSRIFPRDKPARRKELVDTLFALTSFEFYRHLDQPGRSAQQIEAIVCDLAQAALALRKR
ncbi:TetR/AcrR family transcriptional regulator [Roseiterribacter gracilis]|uniref:TetR family transcriptional regulator n=1 Tax=Roseiterribacter gracilis TaxID=2812848 RepID=A0A8S8XDA5_9PROT|nr:TetR family transcriptional regulator [Rhodospirillales bacterium TMPK1]